MRKVAYVVSSLILTACGGGGGGTTSTNTNTNTTPTTPTSVVVEKPYFTEVANAAKVEYPYTNTFLNLTAFDISGDGKDDIIIHQMAWKDDPVQVGNIPCDNVLKVYVMQPDNTFSDQTVSYVQNNNLSACSRKLRISDVNKDGKRDLVFALNQEDGRLQANAHDMNAQNAVLVSNGSIYSIKKFGTPSWYHAVGIGYDSNDRAFVTGSGYTNSDVNAYYFDNLNNTSVALFASMAKNNVSDLSPTTFELFSSDPNKKYTDLLLQAGNFYPNFTFAEGYSHVNGKWSRVGMAELVPIAGYGKMYTFTGEYGGEGVIVKYKDYHLAFAGMSESCTLQLKPNDKTTVVFLISGSVVPNFTPGMTVQQRGLKVISFFKGATIENNVVKEVALNIENEVIEDNAGTFECKDINNDGYTDIIKYPFSVDGLPNIYINNKQNGFTYYGKTNLPKNTLGWEVNGKKNAASLLQDFDKDGYSDLLIYAPQDVHNIKSVTFKFYKGQKPL